MDFQISFSKEKINQKATQAMVALIVEVDI